MSANYDYTLPSELIASAPAEPRDNARLFIYDTRADRVTLDAFMNIAAYLPADSLLVLNDTKVVPARLTLAKPTGGKITILFLANEWDRGEMIKGLPDKGVEPGVKLSLGGSPVVEPISHVDEEYSFRLLVSPAEFERLCEEHGQTPLPPYIHSPMKESDRRQRYQTTFAAKPASVAAPTASLHFTERVFKSLSHKGIHTAPVTLHVGRGTFSPVTEAMKDASALHTEPVEVSVASASAIADAKRAGRMIVAAGTTATRVLESASGQIAKGESYKGETSIFIAPPYEFKLVDALITNFHLPGTSLLMLLDAFLQQKGSKKTWRELYELAIAEKFRFYSFGDAMLVV